MGFFFQLGLDCIQINHILIFCLLFLSSHKERESCLLSCIILTITGNKKINLSAPSKPTNSTNKVEKNKMEWKTEVWSRRHRRLVQWWVTFAEKKKKGTQHWKRRSICSEGNKSERFTVFARPPNSLAPFQELLRMIYKEAELSACPNFHYF